MSAMAGSATVEGAGFPGEFGLALECCVAAFRGGPTREFVDFEGIDWRRLARIARFHRIEGLVSNCLASSPAGVPEEISGEFSAAAADIAARNLGAAAECRDLLAEFEAAEVPLLFLKGLTLGALAYANASLKSAIDVDLLIDPSDLGKASGLLRKRGYRLVIPSDDSALDRWHRRAKESVWMRKEPALQIDLHTRIADSPRLVPDLDVHSPSQLVDVGSEIVLPTFADEELFAYLAVHGAWSAWFRLKWIADFAGLVQARGPDEIGCLYERSRQLGAGRAAGQALLLADRLFGTLGPATELRKEIAGDRPTRLLCEGALRIMTGDLGEPTERRLGTLQIHLLELLLMPGLSYKASELARQLGKLALPSR
jgi:Uncharacterised nucleotidyltransferase